MSWIYPLTDYSTFTFTFKGGKGGLARCFDDSVTKRNVSRGLTEGCAGYAMLCVQFTTERVQRLRRPLAVASMSAALTAKP